MTTTDTPQILGLDLASTLATVDAQLDPAQVSAAAARIAAVFSELVADPANHSEVAGCVPIRLARPVADLPRELFDAAIRLIDGADEPQLETTYLDRPTPADIAAAVVTVTEGEIYLVNQLGSMDDE